MKLFHSWQNFTVLSLLPSDFHRRNAVGYSAGVGKFSENSWISLFRDALGRALESPPLPPPPREKGRGNELPKEDESCALGCQWEVVLSSSCKVEFCLVPKGKFYNDFLPSSTSSCPIWAATDSISLFNIFSTCPLFTYPPSALRSLSFKSCNKHLIFCRVTDIQKL